MNRTETSAEEIERMQVIIEHNMDYRAWRGSGQEAQYLYNAGLRLASDGLSAAWAEVEAALPKGWELVQVGRVRIRGLETMQRWGATAAPIIPKGRDWRGKYIIQFGDGPVPTAALRALAAKLRETP